MRRWSHARSQALPAPGWSHARSLSWSYLGDGFGQDEEAFARAAKGSSKEGLGQESSRQAWFLGREPLGHAHQLGE